MKFDLSPILAGQTAGEVGERIKAEAAEAAKNRKVSIKDLATHRPAAPGVRGHRPTLMHVSQPSDSNTTGEAPLLIESDSAGLLGRVIADIQANKENPERHLMLTAVAIEVDTGKWIAVIEWELGEVSGSYPALPPYKEFNKVTVGATTPAYEYETENDAKRYGNKARQDLRKQFLDEVLRP